VIELPRVFGCVGFFSSKESLLTFPKELSSDQVHRYQQVHFRGDVEWKQTSQPCHVTRGEIMRILSGDGRVSSDGAGPGTNPRRSRAEQLGEETDEPRGTKVSPAPNDASGE
jgi:hypothetical protein